MTTHAGDAHAANRAIQMIDPWPPESSNTDIESDGARGVKAIEDYRTGPDADTSGNNGSIVLVPSSGTVGE